MIYPKNNKLALLVIGGSIAILSACSSAESDPTKLGGELGGSYCDCLGDSKSILDGKQIDARIDSCDNVIKATWTKNETDFKSDKAKWELFTKAYQKATEGKLGSFRDAQKTLYAEVEKTIIAQLNGNLWSKKDENKGYSLYSFDQSSLSILNCRGESKFTLSVDTLKFEDADATMATVRFTDDGNMILTDCKSAKSGEYQKGNEKDKLLGSWSVEGGISVSFYKGGSCAVTQRGTTSNTSYSLNGNNLSIDGPPAYKISLANPDRFSFGQANFHRNKSAQPKTLDFLF